MRDTLKERAARFLPGVQLRPFLKLPGYAAYVAPNGDMVTVWDDDGPIKLHPALTHSPTAMHRAELLEVCRKLNALPAEQLLSAEARKLRDRRDYLAARTGAR